MTLRGAASERIGKRLAHQRRRIVEQHRHRRLGGEPVFLRELGIEIGTREGVGGVRPLARRGGLNPAKELTHDHRGTHSYTTRQSRCVEYRRARLIKRSACFFAID
jgi:hypothetical protein